jgi:hypothetical protein
MIENAAEIEAFRRQTKKERTWMIVGAIIGGLFIGSMMAGDLGALAFVLGPFIGASLGTIIRMFSEHGAIVGIISIIVAPIVTIYRFVTRTRNMKLAEEIVAGEIETLQMMEDYMAHTQALASHKGVDLASLASQGSELYNNSYTQRVLKQGEQAAQAELRRGVVQIAENGEIIRTFGGGKRDAA